MNLRGLLIGVFLFVVATPSFATCMIGERLDLRAMYPQVFQKLPIQDQGNYGICYAYAASTMIDFFRIQRKSDRYQDYKTNAVDAAQAASIFTTDGDPEGGEICDVSDALVNRGYGCDSLGSLPAQLNGVGLAAQVQVVNLVFMDYILNKKVFEPVDPKSYDYPARRTLPANQQDFLNKFETYMTWVRTYLGSRSFGPDALPTDQQFLAFIQEIHTKNRYDIFPASFEALLGKKNCQATSFTMPKLVCEKVSSTTTSLITKIDQQLRAQMPTGVSICANVFTNARYQGVFAKPASDCLAHAVVVIGKRQQGGQCSYLIRNSWGANYPSYAWPKDQGDFWISEDALRSNIYSASLMH